ncbi:MAG: membrane dipeptidase [Ruminococcus sp.]|nr:membrane dipeptidase [Ruminococcus sp.]
MQFFDLHCDTLFRAVTERSDFNDPDFHINIQKAKCFDTYKQMFAIWIPDTLKGNSATRLFNDAVKVFNREKKKSDDVSMFIAVENASMLAGKIDNIRLLIDNDVKYVTLTWNGENELGCGALCDKNYGLSQFGKDVVRELDKYNISVDVSHTSDKLFYDIFSVSTKPIIATHSNSRFITNSKRNLSDEQFKLIIEKRGLVGLNFYKGFLNDNEDSASIEDILVHAEHFLKLGGEDVLAIGADFDGADMPSDIMGLETVPTIYSRFLANFGAKLTKKVFFDNANMYFTNFDNNSDT